MSVRPEVLPFVGVALLMWGALALLLTWVTPLGMKRAVLSSGVFGVILIAYLLYFFRDPDRTAPKGSDVVVSGADGVVARIKELSPAEFRASAKAARLEEEQLGAFVEMPVVRISIFLSLFNVHVNRAPIAGTSHFLGYFGGERMFTFKEKSSERNQHNSILIEGARTRCLVNQIVGPVARRVVYWPDHDRPVDLVMGERIGMMKFGSRLDMYFPRDDIILEVREGDKARAGETVIARIRGEATE